MAIAFRYTAKDLMGNDMTGVLKAESEQEVIEQLKAKELVVLSVVATKKRTQRFGSVKEDELIAFNRQLATMIDAGLPIIQSLAILRDQAESPAFKKVLEAVTGHVEEGGTLVDAFSLCPTVFENLVVQMVGAGEASGKLVEVLTKLSGYLEKARSIKKKVKSAMTYPAVMLAVCLLITTFLIVKIVPTFAMIFKDMKGMTLPVPTQILMGTSDWVRANLLRMIIIIGVSFYAIKKFKKTPTGKSFFDRLSLRLPIFGDLIRRTLLSRFASTLSALMSSGVSILASLEIVKKILGNAVYDVGLTEVIEGVSWGHTDAGAREKAKFFPTLMVKMVEVGEKTGRLGDMLESVANYYEEQVNTSVTTLTSMLEPLVMVVLGTLIGGIVMALFLPILKMSSGGGG